MLFFLFIAALIVSYWSPFLAFCFLFAAIIVMFLE